VSRDGWEAAVQSWETVLGHQRARATVETYVKHVRWLAVDVAGMRPCEVTSAVLEDYLRRQRWSRGTRAKALVSLRAFYAWAMDEGLCSRSPLAGVTVDHRKPGPAPVSPRMVAWAQPIAEFCTSLRAGGRCAGTVGVRRCHLFALSELYADPWQVTADDLALYLSRTDITPEYRRAMRNSVTTFYRWAAKTGRIELDPAADLQSVLIPRALPRPITQDALSRAISDADDRQRLILMLGAVAGLRRAEIAALSFRDVAGEQLLVKGKGGHQRLVPLHPRLLSELDAERIRRIEGRCGSGWSGPYLTPTGYVFPSTLRPEPLTAGSVGVIARACLPAGWTLHTLRHRFASQAYAAQRDLRAVQELLGHAKPETTARYAAVPDDARLAAVLGAGL